MPGDNHFVLRGNWRTFIVVAPHKNAGDFITVVDFVTVKEPESHKVQQASGRRL